MRIPQPNVDLESFSIADVPACPEPFRLLNRIPIVDNGEPLVDLRETNPELSFGDYCLPYVRSAVADALKAASKNLPEHLDLRIYTALRTLQQQADMYWGNYNRAKEQHPTWPTSTLRRMTNRFFAPPDAKAPPGHCTGGAVDVALLRRDTGEALDMRSPIEGWKSAPTAVHGLSPEAAENRRILCFLMYSTGLSNCHEEFWHWSFGDSAWAARVGAPAACYGLIEPPEGATRVTGAKVEIHPYDPQWATQFESIRLALTNGLGDAALRIEHVGSTSVPGLAAKPILDIDIVTRDMPAVIAALDALGYEHQGDLGVAGREAFRAKRGEEFKDVPCRSWPAHHLYACLEGSRELRRHVAYRDFLRSHPRALEEYAALKARLATRYPWDRIRYNDGKESFVEGILREIDPGLVDQGV